MTETLLDEKDIPSVKTEEDVSQCLRDARMYPLLTPEQEKEIAKGCARGDRTAIRTMVNSNLRLVVSVAREFTGRGLPLLDLIQEGCLGLLAAAKKFDHTKDCKFSTCATKWIRQGIKRGVLNQAGLIRVPLHTLEKIRKVMAVQAALRAEAGHEPEIGEIAQRTGFSEDKVEEYLTLSPKVGSLDTLVGEDGDSSLQDMLENIQAPQPQEMLVRKELERTMDALLGKLTQRQQQVLRLRFGMDDGVCHSLQQIGDSLGISKERARQIEQQAIEKLRRIGDGIGLGDFL